MVLAEMFVIIGYGALMHRSGLSLDTGVARPTDHADDRQPVLQLGSRRGGPLGRPWYEPAASHRMSIARVEAYPRRSRRRSAKLEARGITKFYPR